jgi:hypothetical protein
MSECPRWRLLAAHYINVPVLPDGTRVEWEHKETNRESGRAVRKLYQVPMMLNPEDPGDHNYPGEIIVAQHADGAHFLRQDLLFEGPPTRDMEPLNEAAEAITEQHKARWVHPIETLPANGGMNSQEQAFMASMMAAFAKEVGAAQSVPNTSVSREAYDELKERLAKLEAMIAAQNKPAEPTTSRRA